MQLSTRGQEAQYTQDNWQMNQSDCLPPNSLVLKSIVQQTLLLSYLALSPGSGNVHYLDPLFLDPRVGYIGSGRNASRNMRGYVQGEAQLYYLRSVAGARLLLTGVLAGNYSSL